MELCREYLFRQSVVVPTGDKPFDRCNWPTWRDTHGFEYPFKQMETRHLINAIALLERRDSFLAHIYEWTSASSFILTGRMNTLKKGHLPMWITQDQLDAYNRLWKDKYTYMMMKRELIVRQLREGGTTHL